MSQPLSDLLVMLRQLSSDTATANVIYQETPIGSNNGTNVNFRVQNQNVIPGSVYTTINTAFRSQTGFTLDYPNGLITFSSAPANNANPFYIDYTFNWFPDADHIEFIKQGARNLGFTDPTLADDGLIPAMLQFALYGYWMRRASSYAHRYPSHGGSAGQNISDVPKEFKEFAKVAWSAAVSLRDDFYKAQGRRLKPSSTSLNYGIDPYTPIR